jgi:hypothetical protein
MKTGAQEENVPHRTRTSAGAGCGRTAGPPGSAPVCSDTRSMSAHSKHPCPPAATAWHGVCGAACPSQTRNCSPTCLQRCTQSTAERRIPNPTPREGRFQVGTYTMQHNPTHYWFAWIGSRSGGAKSAKLSSMSQSSSKAPPSGGKPTEGGRPSATVAGRDSHHLLPAFPRRQQQHIRASTRRDLLRGQDDSGGGYRYAQ